MKYLAIEPTSNRLFTGKSVIKTSLADIGYRLAFFLVIYVILVFKILTTNTVSDELIFGIYSLAITGYIFSRFFLSYFHKKHEYDESFEPTVSFVVPSKNEGENIAKTILCFGEVNYPLNKIEVIAINDGSTDNTLEEMRRAATLLESRVKRVEVVDWQVNRGKREGMAEGVRRATGEIIIFIDSDSFIQDDCIKHLVKYFSAREVGAVSGHTDVYNSDDNMLTQMQAVRYFLAFKVYKAAESVFGMVTCCPGCCSAYRREYLMEFLEPWLNQKFLGKKCTFGDDRSLTNYMIKKYKTVYSEEALAHTIVPNKFSVYKKQQQRWKKSWVRETLVASTFIWKKNVVAAIFFYMYVLLALASPFVFIRAVIWHPLSLHTWPLAYLGGLFLMLLLHGLYYRVSVGKKPWFLAVVSFWFHTVVLMYQLPLAFFTINDTKWGTR